MIYRWLFIGVGVFFRELSVEAFVVCLAESSTWFANRLSQMGRPVFKAGGRNLKATVNTKGKKTQTKLKMNERWVILWFNNANEKNCQKSPRIWWIVFINSEINCFMDSANSKLDPCLLLVTPFPNLKRTLHHTDISGDFRPLYWCMRRLCRGCKDRSRWDKNIRNQLL